MTIPHAAQRRRSVVQRVAGFAGTFRGRIFTALLAMSLITGALGYYATVVIQRAGQLVAKTYDESLMSINYARAAAADFAGMQTLLAREVLAQDRSAADKAAAKIEAMTRTLEEDLAIAEERAQSQRAREAVAKVREAVAGWVSASKILMSEGGDRNAAWAAVDHSEAVVGEQIDLLVNYTAGDGFTYREHALQTIATDIRFNWMGTALAVITAAAVAWTLGRRMIRSVATAADVASRMANGDLDAQVPEGNGDEFAMLLAAMRVMRDNIRKAMDGEVSLRRTAETAHHRLQTAVGDFPDVASEALAEIHAAALHLRQSSASLMDLASNSASLADQAQHAVGLSTDGVISVSHLTRNLASGVAEIGDRMARTVSIVGEGHARAGAMRSQAAELTAAVERIAGFVDVIRKVAHQTNLLALNATIEAARAGATGRGFSVVAAEVKHLAQETAEATHAIEQQVADIRRITEITVEGIAFLASAMDNVAVESKEASSAVAVQHRASGEIADVMTKISRGTDTINGYVENTSEATRMTSRTANEVIGSADAVANAADRLGQDVHAFLTRLGAA
jgi:methyl-accepting chemotaxis protein